MSWHGFMPCQAATLGIPLQLLPPHRQLYCEVRHAAWLSSAQANSSGDCPSPALCMRLLQLLRLCSNCLLRSVLFTPLEPCSRFCVSSLDIVAAVLCPDSDMMLPVQGSMGVLSASPAPHIVLAQSNLEQPEQTAAAMHAVLRVAAAEHPSRRYSSMLGSDLVSKNARLGMQADSYGAASFGDVLAQPELTPAQIGRFAGCNLPKSSVSIAKTP